MLEWLPDGASSFAGDVDALIALIYYIVGAWFLLLHGLLLYMLIRFRRRPGRTASYLHGNTLRQSAWILVPGLIVLALDLWIDARGARVWATIKESVPAEALMIQITAKQFNWEMLYPGPDGIFGTKDDLQLENALHVPVDEVVSVKLRSEDVIHSFFLPELRLKQDAVPGREIGVWFRATRMGRFEIACAELCGFGHTGMRGLLTVHAPDGWRRWVARHWPPGGAQASRVAPPAHPREDL